MLVVISSVVVVAGIVSAYFGLVGRRIGEEPTCPQCEYNLVASEPGPCPECGCTWDRSNVRTGVRRRRLGLLAGGLVPIVFGSAILAGIFSDPIRAHALWHGPTGLLSILAANDSIDAMCILYQRVASNQVTTESAQTIIRLGLGRQRECNLPRALRWLDLLARIQRAGQMSLADQERFLSQMVDVELITRPRTLIGRRTPFELRLRSYAPLSGVVLAHIRCVQTTVAGSSMPSTIDFGTALLEEARVWPQGPLRCLGRERAMDTSGLSLGHHALGCRLEMDMKQSSAGRPDSWVRIQRDIASTIEIVASDPTPATDVRMLDAAEEVWRHLEIHAISRPPWVGVRRLLEVRWRMRSKAPCDAVLSVIVESVCLEQRGAGVVPSVCKCILIDDVRLHEGEVQSSFRNLMCPSGLFAEVGDSVKVRVESVDRYDEFGCGALQIDGGIELGCRTLKVEDAEDVRDAD